MEGWQRHSFGAGSERLSEWTSVCNPAESETNGWVSSDHGQGRIRMLFMMYLLVVYALPLLAGLLRDYN